MNISMQYLRECFDADFELGQLRWRARPDAHFSCASAAKRWRAKFSGKVTGGPHKEGYMAIYISVDGRRHGLLVHRVLWAMRNGAWPKATIDHKDTVRTNNCWRNLREATYSDQNANRPAIRAGLKGATLDRRTGRYVAQITRNGRYHFLGRFASELEAHKAYEEAATAMHGEFARSV